MAPDWVTALAAAGAVVVSILTAWHATRNGRARRRAEEAMLGLELAEKLASVSGATDLSARAEKAARFAAHEYSKLTLSTGAHASQLIGITVYGVILVWFGTWQAVTATDTPNSVAGLVIELLGFGLLIYVGVATFMKAERRSNQRSAGLEVPTVFDELRAEKNEWQHTFALYRLRLRNHLDRRAGRRAMKQTDSDGE
ncbi:hypothetical protein [Agromyces sp. NPDC058126]|uniref:hypothetical protein n=1 Tax=Agromyces sp. NPDC058126 TaxID=3346350 RepID=UPI0036DF2191